MRGIFKCRKRDFSRIVECPYRFFPEPSTRVCACGHKREENRDRFEFAETIAFTWTFTGVFGARITSTNTLKQMVAYNLHPLSYISAYHSSAFYRPVDFSCFYVYLYRRGLGQKDPGSLSHPREKMYVYFYSDNSYLFASPWNIWIRAPIYARTKANTRNSVVTYKPRDIL